MNKKFLECLDNVRKPARYTGGEFNAVVKDLNDVDVRYGLCFPDIYEIAMSHLGSKILYGLLNSLDGVWCERIYSPFTDMEEEMRKRGVPLFSLESHDAASDFDMLGFSLQYELNYTSVINMLDLAGLKPFSKDREELSPLIIGGGPCVYNCEPVADFFDVICVGEAEETLPQLIELYRHAKAEGLSKQAFLERACKIDGMYVPSFYSVEYHENGKVKAVTASHGAPEVVRKSVVSDLDKAFFPDTFVVPSTDIVFDRAMIELFRGCRRGCRFCQAGYTYRPIRTRRPETLEAQAKKLVETTGFDEVSLSSLSSSDYPYLSTLCDNLVADFEPRHVNLALPSLRADNFDMSLMENVQKVRKSGLTFAPEAGSQRLRDVINKNIFEEDLLNACRVAFGGGYNSVKLYFMMGLPTETEEDLLGISQIVKNVMFTFRQHARNKAKGLKVSVGIATFVPKAQTPFQWVGQTGREENRFRQQFLMDSLKIRNVTFSLSRYDSSFLEAVFARGDRRLSAVIHRAWELGCKLDGWDENFKADKWFQAFSDCGIDPGFYAYTNYEYEDIFPWDHISSGVTKKYLYDEYLQALKGVATPDCKEGCRGCGALGLTGGKCDV